MSSADHNIQLLTGFLPVRSIVSVNRSAVLENALRLQTEAVDFVPLSCSVAVTEQLADNGKGLNLTHEA